MFSVVLHFFVGSVGWSLIFRYLGFLEIISEAQLDLYKAQYVMIEMNAVMYIEQFHLSGS